MALRYVRSTDGSNGSNGTTWDLAKLDLVGVDAIDTAGDQINVSNNHNESTAAAITLTFAGTVAAPTRLICVLDTSEPPTTLSTAGNVSTTGASSIQISGHVYVYGLTFNVGTSGGGGSMIMSPAGGDTQIYENCVFNIVQTNANGRIQPSGCTQFRAINCDMGFGATGQGLRIGYNTRWTGGAMKLGSLTPVNLIVAADATFQAKALFENLDLSGFDATMNLSIAPTNMSTIIFRNCKLPAAWSGSLLGTAFTTAGRISMYNCDSGSTNYRLWIEDFYGTIRDETTIVRTGGASDGVTPLAWKMTSSANAVYPLGMLASDEFVLYNSTTGSAKTLTVEIIHDSVTNLTNADVWLEVTYLGTSGFPIGSFVSDRVAGVLTAAADQTASVATWTTTGLANPNTQALSVSLTPQKKGYFHCRVMLAATSKVIYVDPKITVT